MDAADNRIHELATDSARSSKCRTRTCIPDPEQHAMTKPHTPSCSWSVDLYALMWRQVCKQERHTATRRFPERRVRCDEKEGFREYVYRTCIQEPD